MRRTFFSVIIPVFNRAYCIERCLKSVERCLEVGSFEVVLVDDGSEDNSVEIVNNFIKEKAGKPRLKYNRAFAEFLTPFSSNEP